MARSSILAMLPTGSTSRTLEEPDRAEARWTEVRRAGAPHRSSAPGGARAVIGCQSPVVSARQPDWQPVSSGVPSIIGGPDVSCRAEEVTSSPVSAALSMHRSEVATTLSTTRLDRQLHLYATVEAAINGAAAT